MPCPALPRLPCSVELVRWSDLDKGCQKTVGHAKAIFNSAFCEPPPPLLSPGAAASFQNVLVCLFQAYA